jgi:hypothetical protein
MTEEIQDVVVLFCAPLSQYPEQPTDVSKCRLIDCPHCQKPMWLSQKKEGIIALAKSMEKEIILACFICFKEMVLKNPEILKDYKKINI